MSRTKESTQLGRYSSVEDAYINLAAEIYLRGIHENDQRFLMSSWGQFLKDSVLEHTESKLSASDVSTQNSWTNQPFTGHSH